MYILNNLIQRTFSHYQDEEMKEEEKSNLTQSSLDIGLFEQKNLFSKTVKRIIKDNLVNNLSVSVTSFDTSEEIEAIKSILV